MQLVIKVLNKVKKEHEEFLDSTQNLLNSSKAVHFPKFMAEKRENSKKLLEEVGDAIQILSSREK